MPPTTVKTSKFSRRRLLKYIATTPLAAAQPSTAATLKTGLLLLVPPRFALDASHKAFEARSGVSLRTRPLRPQEDPATALQQSGADLCLVSGHAAPYWRARELLAPWDRQHLTQVTQLHEPLLRIALDHWRFDSTGPFWLPTVWGAEGICWRSDMTQPSQPASYADLWEDASPNSTLIRPRSAIQAVAYLLEDRGLLAAGSVTRARTQMAESRRVHQAALRYMTTFKDRVKLTWNDAQTQMQGLLEDGASRGQGWDTAALALKAANEPVEFAAPKEGALCWSTGWVLSRRSRQSEAAHAFLDTCMQPRDAGPAISDHGFHSAVRGAEGYANETYRALYNKVFDGRTIARLRPLTQQSQWQRDIEKEFAYRFLRA